jgi:hypothetical protein
MADLHKISAAMVVHPAGVDIFDANPYAAFPSRCACSNEIGSTAPKPGQKDLPL